MSALPESAWALIDAGRGPVESDLGRVASAEAGALGAGHVERMRGELSATLLGLGPLEGIVAEPGVTDVLVNGDGGIWVDSGEGLRRRDGVRVGSAPVDGAACGPAEGVDPVRALAVRLAARAGRRLDDASPYVDGLLPGGIRLHAILPPLAAGGAHICLRVPAARAWTLDALAGAGMWPSAFTPVLRALVTSRVAFVVTGGTGAGKTTVLAALLGEVSAEERVLVVEDVRELRLGHPHVVHLEARPPNVEGLGEVPMQALVRQALRMRPDRLVVGEVRGAEVRELLAALNTGHEGGCGTLHANAARDVVARFEALGALAGLPPGAARTQLVSAVQVVVHVRRTSAGRQLEGIGWIEGDGSGAVRVVEAVRRSGSALVAGPAWGLLAERLGLGDGPEQSAWC